MTKTKKRIVIISSSILGGLVSLYVFGGIAAAFIVSKSLLSKRQSLASDLDEIRLTKTQKNYPLLQDRELVRFASDGDELQGYLYKNDNPKGLVVAAHGITSQADDSHASYQNFFLENGYSVFSFDMVASGRSSGEDAKGLHQSALNVRDCLSYIHSNDEIKDLPIFMIGHSWGGYGVSAALNFDQTPKAVVSFSGYDMPKEEIFEFAKSYAGNIAYAGKWQIDFAQECLSKYSSTRAVTGINKATETRFLSVQGSDDPTVPYEASIYSKFDEITNDHAQRIFLEGYAHKYVWYSKDSYEYITNELEPAYDRLKEQYSGNIPDDIKKEFIENINYEKSSQLNLDLFNSILSMFEESI
ncbi:MAG: alpha/beta fold hydrolase [Bacilli bacterium]|nr:alpha/beta fold hydrolase [Bacilli bacterium]